MEKRKITPLLVATILTAGIATGAHTLNLPEAYSHTIANKLTNRNKKNDNEEDSSISKKNETVKENSIIPKAFSNLHKGAISPKENVSQTEQNNISVSSVENNNANKNSHTYNAPVNKEVQKAAPTHKVMPKQSFNSNVVASNIQSKAKVNSQTSEQSQESIAVNNKLSLPEGNILVNGTKIASQLKSDAAIATTAKEITSGCSNDYQKAQAIYVWVARNMYYSKAEENTVLNGSKTTNCGAIHAFNSREGICEDFSTLYAVMANEVGLTTRVVAGQGYGNGQWIAHAWNQVYIPSMGWINVDTTFANSYVALINANNLPFNNAGILSTEPYYTYKTSEYSYKIYTEDYFDTTNFNATHKNAEILAQLGTI